MSDVHEDIFVFDRKGNRIRAADYVTTSYKDRETNAPVHHRLKAVFPNGYRSLQCPVVLYEDGGFDPASLVALDRAASSRAARGKPLQIRRSARIRVMGMKVHNTCCGYEYEIYGSPLDEAAVPLECERCGAELQPLSF